MHKTFLTAPMLALLLSVPLAAAPLDEHQEELPQSSLEARDLAAVDAVSTAYFQGNSVLAMNTLVPLVARLDDQQIEEVDQILDEREVPGVGQLLAESRLALLQQGLARELPKASAQEAVLLLPEMKLVLQTILENASAQPVMADVLPAPEDIQEYEDLLWNVHVLTNQLQNARVIAEYMDYLAKRVPRQQLAKLDEQKQRIVNTHFERVVNHVVRKQQELEEREIELRIQRLALAKDKLDSPKISKEKFLAAYTWQNDAAVIEDFFEARKNKRGESEQFIRSRLNDSQFIEQAANDRKEAERLAGDLSVKSQLLYQGLHWWLRGRYGMGPEVFGLAKSPAALTSIEAQFPLFMPIATPRPTDPAVGSFQGLPEPRYERRHHYWWAWEDRRVARSGFNGTNKNTHSDTSQLTKYRVTTDRFY